MITIYNRKKRPTPGFKCKFTVKFCKIANILRKLIIILVKYQSSFNKQFVFNILYFIIYFKAQEKRLKKKINYITSLN